MEHVKDNVLEINLGFIKDSIIAIKDHEAHLRINVTAEFLSASNIWRITKSQKVLMTILPLHPPGSMFLANV